MWSENFYNSQTYLKKICGISVFPDKLTSGNDVFDWKSNCNICADQCLNQTLEAIVANLRMQLKKSYI